MKGRGKYFVNRRFPPVAFISQVGEVTDAEQAEHLQELLDLARADLAKGVRWVVVIDTRVSAPNTPTQRKQLSAFLKEHNQLVRAASVAHLVIVDSALIRGAITALRWLGALPRDFQSVANYAEAISRARVELERHGCPPVPDALVGPGGEQRALGEVHTFARGMKMREAGS